uniref:DUF218 domain-containing protein n=1 Tax=Chlamydomonas chlamydogama TaxID=225041 RepID=A0A7S2QT06_9CHLO
MYLARLHHPSYRCVQALHQGLRRSTHVIKRLSFGQQQYSVPAAPNCVHRHGSTDIAWLQSLANVPSPSNGEAAGQTSVPTDLDAIIMLAGGQTTEGSGLPTWVERRLDACLDLQRVQKTNCPIVCLGGGTPHKPPILTPRGYVVHESTACADYLIARGASPSRLLKEVSSYDTVGNAYFALTIHVIPGGWRRLGVITSDFHMPRTRTLFQDMSSLVAQDLFRERDRFSFCFIGVSDEGLFEGEVLAARHAKEAAATAAWRHNFSSMTGLADLHHWLHQTHQCYAVSRQHEFDVVTIRDPRLLASY